MVYTGLTPDLERDLALPCAVIMVLCWPTAAFSRWLVQTYSYPRYVCGCFSQSLSWVYHGNLILQFFCQYLKTQSSEKVIMLLQTRVFPLYSMVAPTPYVLANANWLLGELATCLPEVLFSINASVFRSLIPKYPGSPISHLSGKQAYML